MINSASFKHVRYCFFFCISHFYDTLFLISFPHFLSILFCFPLLPLTTLKKIGIALRLGLPVGEGREFPLILGRDVAGKVEAVGSTVTLYKPGDDVYAATDYVHRVRH